jgi:ADP-dependent NAD(P)H-hydrate dehydratase / NAD(P)H-hydrate epimerase
VFKVVSVEQMREIERAADAGGVTYALMMENAGRSIAGHILRRVGEIGGRRVAILVGTGNNGGDGLVVGHYLAEAGAQVAAYLVKERSPDDVNLARLQGHGALVAVAGSDQRQRVLRNLVGSADLIVDALLGTGFHLPLEGSAKEILEAAGHVLASRDSRPLIVAVDCPSGLDCDSGEAAPETLTADVTVTLAAAKPGLLTGSGPRLVGEIVHGDIGLPAGFEPLMKAEVELAERSMLRAWQVPRLRDAHKGTFGRALIVAGSVNYPGAAALAGEAAYRVGAGLVTLAVPSVIQPMLAPQIPEATWLLLPHEMGAIIEGAAAVVEPELGKCQSILIGPGFGQDPATAEFVGRLLHGGRPGKQGMGFVHRGASTRSADAALPACVVDADGLKLLARLDSWPALLPERSVLTPHPGEMAALTGLTTEEIQRNRLTLARQTAASWRHIVVLKGAYTIVADPKGPCVVLPFATPALARAGTGDVLAGAIAGLLAQGMDPWQAAVMGGFLHGRAGELAAEALEGAAAVMASDVLASLPSAMADLNAA